MNGDKGKIQGFELGYQQFYDACPMRCAGFGLQANFTYVDSSGGRTLRSTPGSGAAQRRRGRHVATRRTFQDELQRSGACTSKYGVSARLAYNWRERYLLTTSAANIDRPVWAEDYGQLDASVF